jgi:hypothetical protein
MNFDITLDDEDIETDAPFAVEMDVLPASTPALFDNPSLPHIDANSFDEGALAAIVKSMKREGAHATIRVEADGATAFRVQGIGMTVEMAAAATNPRGTSFSAKLDPTGLQRLTASLSELWKQGASRSLVFDQANQMVFARVEGETVAKASFTEVRGIPLPTAGRAHETESTFITANVKRFVDLAGSTLPRKASAEAEPEIIALHNGEVTVSTDMWMRAAASGIDELSLIMDRAQHDVVRQLMNSTRPSLNTRFRAYGAYHQLETGEATLTFAPTMSPEDIPQPPPIAPDRAYERVIDRRQFKAAIAPKATTVALTWRQEGLGVVTTGPKLRAIYILPWEHAPETFAVEDRDRADLLGVALEVPHHKLRRLMRILEGATMTAGVARDHDRVFVLFSGEAAGASFRAIIKAEPFNGTSSAGSPDIGDEP